MSPCGASRAYGGSLSRDAAVGRGSRCACHPARSRRHRQDGGGGINTSRDRRAGVFRALLRNRDALRILGAYALFGVCECALWIAVLVYAYDQGGPGTAGLVAVAELVPAAALALLVAPLSRRLSPALVLQGGYAVQSVTAVATAALLLTGSTSLLVYAGAVLLSGAMGVTRPAQSALLPALSTEVDQLTACNVVLGWVENLSILVAGVATGLALSFGNVGHVFGGAAVLLLVGTVLVWPLRGVSFGRPAAAAEQTPGPGASRQLWQDRPARLLVGLLGAEQVVAGSLDLLFVLLAVDVIGAGQSWAGYLNTAYGAGSLLFGLIAAVLVGRRLGPVALGTAAVLGAALSLCAVTGLLGVVPLLALVGGSRTLFDVSLRVLLQRSVSPDRMAHLFGVVESVNMLGLAAGALLVPALVALGGPGLAILGTAALLPLLVVVRARRVLRIDQHARVPVVEISLLRRIPLFGILPAREMEALAQSLERVTFEPGQTLMREGEPGDAYYALADGTVEVSQAGEHVRFLGRGDGLGEIALLRSVPRTATVVATTPVTSYRLSRDPFLTAVTGHAATLESADNVVQGHVTGDGERHRALHDDSPT
jgi:hypothetical protein